MHVIFILMYVGSLRRPVGSVKHLYPNWRTDERISQVLVIAIQLVQLT